MLTPKAITSDVDDQLLLRSNQSTTYTKSEVDAIASASQRTIALSTNLTVNKFITRNI